TRSRRIANFINDKETITTVVFELLDEHWMYEPIRLLGVTIQDLLDKQYVVHQLDLFTYEEEVKRTKMNRTVKQLKEKYGENTFKTLPSNASKSSSNKLLRTSFQKDFLDDYRK